MKHNKKFFIFSMPIMLALCSLFVMSDTALAAARVATRGTAASRKTVTNTTKTTTETPVVQQEAVKEIIEKSDPIIINKADQFDASITDQIGNSSDNEFAENMRRQRAALAASEASSTLSTEQKEALSTNSSSCDIALRKCMSATCGKDFTKCALDGDTTFGDKLNKCKKDATCSAEEFNLFATEIKSDRDMNARLASFNKVLDCGNTYNSCIEKECGKTFNKCLGKTSADSAIQKCANIAKECNESDSGLAARFGTAIGKLRENAEKDVKKDESRLYELRDLMAKSCRSLGATFDERSFDCVYSVEFFAGENQSTPLASRKAYAGDTFVCTQEWFGVNATTYRENAYRETRSQTATSSAMLGAGLGTAAGLVTSGAIDRALDTQKAKKDLKEECKKQGGKLKNGKCVGAEDTKTNATEEKPTKEQNEPNSNTLNESKSSASENQTIQQSQQVENKSSVSVSTTPAGEVKITDNDKSLQNKMAADKAVSDIKAGKTVIPPTVKIRAPKPVTSPNTK